MKAQRLLLLGGIGEALRIARQLPARHVYSLAGIGRIPDDLPCQVRSGGFGGAEGLAHYLQTEGIDLVVDATHPYAAQISANAVQAAAASAVPCWALRRAGWQAQADDIWHEVADWSELQNALRPYRRPFFTLGREPLAHLNDIPAEQFWTVRALDDYPNHPRARIIGARGPFDLAAERELFTQGRFDVLISKNSGSAATEPKLQIARERRLPVLIMRRPTLPPADQEFTGSEALLNQLQAYGWLTH